ncbi:uncharacterized protein MEPE_04023 [Melanopsichium pennsylvanicum]|uniref:Uncharacterized protein n=1 Tax=Melanopsichium pennsylvanicum TaxID=63383 RepID=A0AAJ4XM21_9BASI|nr:uncharacterized protein MEPE_04023 [Melanopsichium pennsylvanicum]
MYCAQGPSVLYNLRASSLDPRTIRLPLVLWQGASEHARVLSLRCPLGVNQPTCCSSVALVAAVADTPLAIDTFDIRQVTATRRISVRSVETCSLTRSCPIQLLGSALTLIPMSPLSREWVPRKRSAQTRDVESAEIWWESMSRRISGRSGGYWWAHGI